ncbi:zinc finger protein 593 isoform X2 [Sitophilus oryzae]|uniref:Zinc finger protein 593 homolog n=1 Tax=Sitophilus oryzae TaxID=7048 RepID=A0A6J2X7P4_SITOR|nr:zinc finger protein 593 isoform X2 [Sitophilus oryzae]
MVFKRKKYNSGDTNLKKKYKTKRRVKDLDQIDEDLKPENCKQLLHQEVDFDKPGNAQFYCIHCARYFINSQALKEHFTTKLHKRRLKALQEEPYSIEDAERAAGHGSFKAPLKRKIETQDTVESKRSKVEEN